MSNPIDVISMHGSNALCVSRAFSKLVSMVVTQCEMQPIVDLTSLPDFQRIKDFCASPDARLSRSACETLCTIVEQTKIDSNVALSMFMGMLPSVQHHQIIADAVLRVLFSDLEKMKITPYKCPYTVMGDKQHPIIKLFQNRCIDGERLAAKLEMVCHPSLRSPIDDVLLEFLKPVFMYVICNPNHLNGAERVWNTFFPYSLEHPDVLYDIQRWSRVTPDNALAFTTHFIECIDLYREKSVIEHELKLVPNLMGYIPIMIEHGECPHKALQAIIRILDGKPDTTSQFQDYILVSTSQIMHIISTTYFKDIFAILELALEEDSGNIIIRKMVFDSLLVRYATNIKFMHPAIIKDYEKLLDKVALPKGVISYRETDIKEELLLDGQHIFHPNVIMNINLVQHARFFCNEGTDQNEALISLIAAIRRNEVFALEMQYYIRALLLSSSELGMNNANWTALLDRLVAVAVKNAAVATSAIYMILHCVATYEDICELKRIELLRALVSFAVFNENIPLIASTLDRLTSTTSIALHTLGIQLYTRLWLVQPRTYPFLKKILSKPERKGLSQNDLWDLHISKMKAINEIVQRKAKQHGGEMLMQLSDVLSASGSNRERYNDLAVALAIDSVRLLCADSVMTITSTWKNLKLTMDKYPGHRAKESFCRFFGLVATLCASEDYRATVEETFAHLWNIIINTNEPATLEAAFLAMRNYPMNQFALKHVPAILYDEDSIPKQYVKMVTDSIKNKDAVSLTLPDVVPYIPGGCWLQLMRTIRADATIDFIQHLIETEMAKYRTIMFTWESGRPEPWKSLHDVSVLAALIKYIRLESTQFREPVLVVQCLKCLAHAFSRPIPPMDWSFMTELIQNRDRFVGMELDVEMNMLTYALQIGINQMNNSELARVFIETQLNSFDANGDFGTLQPLLQQLPALCNSCPPKMLEKFLNPTLETLFAINQSYLADEIGPFEQVIQIIVTIFDNGCKIFENAQYVALKIAQFFQRTKPGSQFHSRYIDILVKLPTDTVNQICTLGGINVRVALRARAAAIRKPFPLLRNPMHWLNSGINHPQAEIDEIRKVVTMMAAAIDEWNDEETLYEWLTKYIGEVQSQITDERGRENEILCMFKMELLMYSIVIASGCVTFARNDTDWLSKFPQALWILSKRSANNWSNVIVRLFGFLHHVHTQEGKLLEKYVEHIENSLALCKNHKYFLAGSNWSKYLALRSKKPEKPKTNEKKTPCL